MNERIVISSNRTAVAWCPRYVSGGTRARRRLLRFDVVVVRAHTLGSALARATGRSRRYIELWTRYKTASGMSPWRAYADWVSGLPDELGRPAQIPGCFHERGFSLPRHHTPLRWRISEHVFAHDPDGTSAG